MTAGTTSEDLAKRASSLLKGKVVAKVFLPRDGEACVEFTDGTRLFVHINGQSKLELSVT